MVFHERVLASADIPCFFLGEPLPRGHDTGKIRAVLNSTVLTTYTRLAKLNVQP